MPAYITWANGLDAAYIKINGTVNGQPIEFNLDSGSTKILLQAKTAAQIFPQGIKKIAKRWETVGTSFAKGQTIEQPILDATISIYKSPPFVTEIMVNNYNSSIPFNLLPMNELTKVYDVKLTNDTLTLTPVSRTYKNTTQVVKSSRLGWSSDWI